MDINLPYYKAETKVFQYNICSSILKIKTIISSHKKSLMSDAAHIEEAKTLLNHQIDSSTLMSFFSNTSITTKSIVRVIYHVPFAKSTLPGNLYMPKMKEDQIRRVELLGFIAHQINSFEKDSIIIIITTQDFFQSLISFTRSKTKNIFIPIFLKNNSDHIMLSRQYMYYATQELLRGFLPNNYPIIYQDSDLIPMKSSRDLTELSSSLDCPIFCVRSAPNLLPVNGGFYILPIGCIEKNVLMSIVSNYMKIDKISEVSQILGTDIKCWDGDQLALSSYIDFKDLSGLSKTSNGNNVFLASVDSVNMPIKSLNEQKYKHKQPYNIHIKGLPNTIQHLKN